MLTYRPVACVSCGLDGMDYGTPTSLPWDVVCEYANSFAPLDGINRHPDQFYEMLGDLIIAGALIKLRGKMRWPSSTFFS